jgi:hypothetical protein
MVILTILSTAIKRALKDRGSSGFSRAHTKLREISKSSRSPPMLKQYPLPKALGRERENAFPIAQSART